MLRRRVVYFLSLSPLDGEHSPIDYTFYHWEWAELPILSVSIIFAAIATAELNTSFIKCFLSVVVATNHCVFYKRDVMIE